MRIPKAKFTIPARLPPHADRAGAGNDPATRRLTFSPRAWLKLQYLLHAGPTEIGGFGITSPDDPLFVERFVTVAQRATPTGVEFEDAAVADFFDRCVDAGLRPSQYGKVWIHTHPGDCALPSHTDEQTFARAFGRCDWSVMFIASRTGRTYARLAFAAGPGGRELLDVGVDWAALQLATDPPERWAGWPKLWAREYAQNVRVMPIDAASPLGWGEPPASWPTQRPAAAGGSRRLKSLVAAATPRGRRSDG